MGGCVRCCGWKVLEKPQLPTSELCMETYDLQLCRIHMNWKAYRIISPEIRTAFGVDTDWGPTRLCTRHNPGFLYHILSWSGDSHAGDDPEGILPSFPA